MAPKHGRNRQRFDLALADGNLAAGIDRLVALTDPACNEFWLTHG